MPTSNPRLNVTVTPEQHKLLLELARVNGGSAAGYLRMMLDQATPLLRATVPALVMAHDEMDVTKKEAGETLNGLLQAIADAGVPVSPDLFDAAPGTSAASGSERAGAKARSNKPKAG